MPVTYNNQRRNLNGIMDYSFWYGDQANLEMNVIVVEAKPDGEASKGRHQLLVCMGMLSPRSFWIFIDIVLTLQQCHTLLAAMQITGTVPLMEWRLMVTNSILFRSSTILRYEPPIESEFILLMLIKHVKRSWCTLTWFGESSKILIVSHLTRMFRRAAMLSPTVSLSGKSVSEISGCRVQKGNTHQVGLSDDTDMPDA